MPSRGRIDRLAGIPDAACLVRLEEQAGLLIAQDLAHEFAHVGGGSGVVGPEGAVGKGERHERHHVGQDLETPASGVERSDMLAVGVEAALGANTLA